MTQDDKYLMYYEMAEEGQPYLKLRAERASQMFLVNPEFAIDEKVDTTTNNINWPPQKHQNASNADAKWSIPFVYQTPNNPNGCAAFVPDKGMLQRLIGGSGGCSLDDAVQALHAAGKEGVFSPHKPLDPRA